MIALLTPLLATLGPWALVLLGVILFVETGLLVGSFLPGDSLLFAAGVLVASHALPLPMWLVLPVAATAAVLGDQVGYLLGRRFGPRLFSGSGRLLNRRHARSAERFFARYGPRAVVLARFVPVVRGFTPAVAGLAAMPRRRFTAFNLVGAVAWTGLMLLGGSWAGGIPLVAHHVELIVVAIATAGVLPTAFVWLRRRLRGVSLTGRPDRHLQTSAPCVPSA